MSNFNCCLRPLAFQFFTFYRSHCLRRVEIVAILSLISLTQMERGWGNAGWGCFYCFKRGCWEMGNGKAGSFILTSLCVFAILNIFLITSSRTQIHPHTHTHTNGAESSYVFSHSYTNSYIWQYQYFKPICCS